MDGVHFIWYGPLRNPIVLKSGGFPKWGVPQERIRMDGGFLWKILENLKKMDDYPNTGWFISWKIPRKWMIWRLSPFQETSFLISGSMELGDHNLWKIIMSNG